MGPGMPLQTSERAIVHIVDDDAAVRDALERLFDTVGLSTRCYAAARSFWLQALSINPDALSLPTSSVCLILTGDISIPNYGNLVFASPL